MKDQTPLDDQYWSERYLNHQTGWDIGEVSPPLKAYVDQLDRKNISILIPGCGNAHEARYLLENGFTDVNLIDISRSLTDQLKIDFAPFIQKGVCKIIHQDFFDHTGKYDLIIEQTFFCALEPSLRKDYAIQMHQILKTDGKLAGLLFDRVFEGGPPFGGNREEYKALFCPYFDIKVMAPCYNSIAPRMGTESFIILSKS